MYTTCIFCSGSLGTNEAIEHFPVGRGVAFDAGRGRLWAVCPKCGRWNLAPIEERWEAVELAEKRFRDSRLRVHSENVGLAKMPDGTRLIRVGEALPGELAAWRYGDQLVRRRRQTLLLSASVGAGALVWSGLSIAGVLGGGGGLVGVLNLAWMHRKARRIVHRIPATDSPTGEELRLRRVQLNGARLARAGEGDLALHLPYGMDATRTVLEDGRRAWLPPRDLVIRGPEARVVLGRAMVDTNSAGATRQRLGDALGLLDQSGGAERYIERIAERETALGVPHLPDFRRNLSLRQLVGSFRGEILPPPDPGRRPRRIRLSAKEQAELLALEMALHEESERRALKGELAQLEAAWREAEEIAAIADRLPYDPLDRLKEKLA